MLQKLDHFPAEDGHIESILIGVDCMKVSFQTWDARKLVLIFKEVENICASHAVNEDIGFFHTQLLDTGLSRFIFSVHGIMIKIKKFYPLKQRN